MKPVLYPLKINVFDNWIREYCKVNNMCYFWPQICYDTTTAEIIHVVFERNNENKDVVVWPAEIPGIPCTNIDFTGDVPILDNGSEWEFQEWHKVALRSCTLAKQPASIPYSFWNWRLSTRPQGNLSCDLDFLYRREDKSFIGIEATEIYYVDECSSNINQDIYEHFSRLLRFRHGGTSGFNIMQLNAQYNLTRNLKGKLLFLLHQFQKHQNQYMLRTDKVVVIEINEQVLESIGRIIETPQNLVREPSVQYGTVRNSDPVSSPMDFIKRQMAFMPLEQVMGSL